MRPAPGARYTLRYSTATMGDADGWWVTMLEVRSFHPSVLVALSERFNASWLVPVPPDLPPGVMVASDNERDLLEWLREHKLVEAPAWTEAN